MAPKAAREKAAQYTRECKLRKKQAQMDLEKMKEAEKQPENNQIDQNSPNCNELIKVNPTNIVLGALLRGTTYQASSIILIANGQKPCSRSSFFAKQKEMLLLKKQEKMLLKIEMNTFCKIHDGKENTNSLFDLRNRKVVNYHNTIMAIPRYFEHDGV